MWKLWAFEYLQIDCNESGHSVGLVTNFDTSIIKISEKMGKLWAFKKFNMANI